MYQTEPHCLSCDGIGLGNQSAIRVSVQPVWILSVSSTFHHRRATTYVLSLSRSHQHLSSKSVILYWLPFVRDQHSKGSLQTSSFRAVC